METTKKDDFIELEFLGRVEDGEVFDTNIESEGKKIGITVSETPFIICIGQQMVIQGLDKSLEGKEVGKKYTINLSPKEAFQDRNPSLVKLMPVKIFKEKNVTPYPGLTLALDNMLVKIISVSGGRVLVDFNNPLSGKNIVYEFTIKKKIEKAEDKVNSIINFFARQKMEFKIDETKKEIVFTLDNIYKPIISLLNDRFKDILGMEMVISEKSQEASKEEKAEEKKV